MRTADTGVGDEAEGNVDDSNNLYSCSRESCRERSGGRWETLTSVTKEPFLGLY